MTSEPVPHEIGSMLHWETDFSGPVWQWPQPAVYFSICRHAIAALCAAQPRRPRLWLPSFFCPEVARSCRSVADIREYRDNCCRPHPDWTTLKPGARDLVLAVNYFGVRSPEPWRKWREQHDCILVEDHTQDPFSYWALTSNAEYAVASIRKTAPLPDGAILWSPKHFSLPPAPAGCDWQGATLKAGAMLYKRSYLEGKTSRGTKAVFREWQLQGEAELGHAEPSTISPISQAILAHGIPKWWRERRSENARTLLAVLQDGATEPVFNKWPEGHTPFDLPLIFADREERDRSQRFLQAEDVYCPVEWVCDSDDAEAMELSSRILSIPIDQRYGRADMERVAIVLRGIEGSGHRTRELGAECEVPK